jgi:hypothetical protein
LATTVYDIEVVKLQNDEEVTLKPLTISSLRKFMQAMDKFSKAKTEDQTLSVLIDACAIALEKQLPDLVADKEKLEDALDLPTIYRIIKICGGIDLENPNLVAAALEAAGEI